MTQTMKKNICIFVSKNSNPDLYVNIISYLIEKYANAQINSIQLLNIYGHPPDRKEEQKRVTGIKMNILRQLEALSQGKYLGWDYVGKSFKTSEPQDIEISNYYKRFYESILLEINDINIKSKIILENNIELELTQIAQSEGDFIFDVTGLLTRYMVEVTMFSHDNNFTIHAFEITREFQRGHKDLLHNLKHNEMRYPELNLNNYRVYKSDFKEMIMSAGSKSILQKRVDEFRENIGKGKTKEVLDAIIRYSYGNYNLKDEVILLRSSLTTLEREKRVNTTDPEASKREMNKINQSLLNLLNKLKE